MRLPKCAILAICMALGLVACSQTPQPTPAQRKAANQAAAEAAAAKEQKLYDQMRASGSWDVATTLGNEILQKYPGTKAAVAVRRSIDDVHKMAARKVEQRRLQRLWEYTAVKQDGGTQYAAAIPSERPLGPDGARIRLVLRQHPKWGQSVYLLLDKARFDCRKGCATLPVSFDDGPAKHMKATIPPTGEPALFIDDDKGFVARMEKARTVAIGVNIKGVGEKTVTFEVGGYDPSKLPDKPGKKK